MSEDKIIKNIKSFINAIETYGTIDYKCIPNLYEPVVGLLDLYQKQKAKNMDAILECMEEVNQELMDDLLHGKPHRKPLREKIKRLEEELKKEKEKNSKAIAHIEACKTSLGNYILSPNETEYLLKILGGNYE